MMKAGGIVHMTSSWIRIVYGDRTTLRSDKKVVFKYMEGFSMEQVFFVCVCVTTVSSMERSGAELKLLTNELN